MQWNIVVALVTKSCPTLRPHGHRSPPSSSVHDISQARILEWLPFPSPGNLPDPGVEPAPPALAGGFFIAEPPGKPNGIFSSVHFCHSVISDSLQPHGLQHSKLPCPSLFPGVSSNSCPLSRWCYLTISSSAVQQNESAIHIHVFFPFWASIPYRLSQCIKESSLCYTLSSHYLFYEF